MEIDDAQFILADSLAALVWGARGGARGIRNIRQGRAGRRRRERARRRGGLK